MEGRERTREVTIKMNLTNAECEELNQLCAAHGLAINELYTYFTQDLCNHSSEYPRLEESYLAHHWFEGCEFGKYQEKSLLQWLSEDKEMLCEEDDDIDINGLLFLVEDIEIGEEDLERYRENPALFSKEEMEELEENMKEWKKKLEYHKSKYLEENPEADWDAEVKKVQDWDREGKL